MDNFRNNPYIEKLKQNVYYVIISILSAISVFFLPFLGSEIGVDFNFPNTTGGWCVWVISKLAVVIINVLLFYCFLEQARQNVKKDPNYIQATKILYELENKEIIPISPERHRTKQWLTKGITIMIFTALSVVCFAPAILTFDWVQMLTYSFTIVFGIIFGVLIMKADEDWWTNDYLEYAYYVQKNGKKNNKKPKKVVENNGNND